LLKDVTVFANPVPCHFEREPLAVEVGTAVALGTVQELVTHESEVMGSYETPGKKVVSFLVIDSLGCPTHVPYENVTFDTDEGGKLIC